MVGARDAHALLALLVAGEREPAASLAAQWMTHRARVGPAAVGRDSARAMMVTAAHLGAVETVRTLAHELRNELSGGRAQWWIATAEQRAGDVVSARHTLGSAPCEAAPGPSRKMIERRMMFPLTEASLDACACAVRDELEVRALARASLLGLIARSARTTPLTAALACATLLAFCALRHTGDLGPASLAAHGGMLVPLRDARGVCALLTYGFVHASGGHLAVNLASLLALGRLVEPRLGAPRYALVYALSGALGGVVALLTSAPGTVLVGASGSLFGLAGASLAQTLAHKTLRATPEGRLQLAALIALCAAQFALDAGARGVSSGAHLGGLLAGAALGALLKSR